MGNVINWQKIPGTIDFVIRALIFLFIISIPFLIQYFIIKAAVKNGMKKAWKEMQEEKEQEENAE